MAMTRVVAGLVATLVTACATSGPVALAGEPGSDATGESGALGYVQYERFDAMTTGAAPSGRWSHAGAVAVRANLANFGAHEFADIDFINAGFLK